MELEKLSTLPASPPVAEVQPPSPTLVGPSRMIASLPGMVETSTIMLADASVFWDADLIENLLDLILLPCDRTERGGCSMGEILTELFPRVLGVSRFYSC